ARMSTTEVTVILFGLFLGYWVVSKLLVGGKAPPSAGESDAGITDAADESDSWHKDSPAWHEILGIDAEANEAEIRQAYRRLMQQYHPDKVASLGPELRALAERKSLEINTAYRRAMEQMGHSP